MLPFKNASISNGRYLAGNWVPMSLKNYAQVTTDDGPDRNLLVKQLSAATKARYKHEIKKVWPDSGQRIIESQTKIAQVFSYWIA